MRGLLRPACGTEKAFDERCHSEKLQSAYYTEYSHFTIKDHNNSYTV